MHFESVWGLGSRFFRNRPFVVPFESYVCFVGSRHIVWVRRWFDLREHARVAGIQSDQQGYVCMDAGGAVTDRGDGTAARARHLAARAGVLTKMFFVSTVLVSNDILEERKAIHSLTRFHLSPC